MFMAANSLLAGAIQILCVIVYKGDEAVNAEMIARSLKTNPVVVRRILKSLENKGLVEVRQGRNGGVALKKRPADITLDDIYKAVEGPEGLFALRRNGNPRCAVNNSMKSLLTPVFAATSEAVEKTLKHTTLEQLTEKI
jgi:Rrf2 family protein